jgi:acyl-CoA synthetase (NDP forming)
LKRGEIPFYESPETCARAMKVLCDYGEQRRARETF